MTFNPQKCEFLTITNKKNPIIHNYYIENSRINEVPYTKYLHGCHYCMIIDYPGTSIFKELYQQSCLSQCLSVPEYKTLSNKHWMYRSQCYMSMVRLIVEYTSPVWDPYTITSINKLEAIQRAAARFCFNDFSRQSSVTAMLTALDLPTLKSRRTRAKLLPLRRVYKQSATLDQFCNCTR